MKRILIFLVLTLQLFLFTSCKDINNSNITVLKTGITMDNFSISVPEDYEETSSDYIDKYFIKDNSASIIVTSDKNIFQYNNISQYYENSVQQYQSTFDEFKEISTEDIVIDNKYNAKLSEFSYTIASEEKNIEMSCYVEYILSPTCVYIITCSAPSDTYQSYKDDFVKSINSVEFKWYQ